jgi:hypothetical protein
MQGEGKVRVNVNAAMSLALVTDVLVWATANLLPSDF